VPAVLGQRAKTTKGVKVSGSLAYVQSVFLLTGFRSGSIHIRLTITKRLILNG
jgi:hypothetical protein